MMWDLLILAFWLAVIVVLIRWAMVLFRKPRVRQQDDPNSGIGSGGRTMTDTQRLLQSIGQRTFLRCHERAQAKRDEFTVDDLLECDPQLRGTTPSAQRTRVSKLKHIVREGLIEEALSLCDPRRGL